MEKLKLVEAMQLKSNLTEFHPGDTVNVHVRVIEGDKERIQQFQGVENPEEKIIQIAKERHESLKTRDIPWEIYLPLMRGVIKNILQDHEKRSQKEAVSNQLAAKK